MPHPEINRPMAESRFALIGAAGYIAPRHMAAIRSIGGEIVACCDPFDSVGVIDRYFPDASFFAEFERFDRHIHKLHGSGVPLDYVAICSPNHLHDPHLRWALRAGADPVCEKPLVLNPDNLNYLQDLEVKSGRRVRAILQLRLHPEIAALKSRVEQDPSRHFEVSIVTVTPRGRWYDYSWKGEQSKSGGLATNIGIHLFDMMCWIFGSPQELRVSENSQRRSVGRVVLERATVDWYLSINREDLDKYVRNSSGRPFRRLRIDGDEVEFASGFEDLHLESYRQIVGGAGFGIDDARCAIELVHEIRMASAQSVE